MYFNPMNADLRIQKEVMDELKWKPCLSASEIGVAVKNGIVTLSGVVDSPAKKLAAENAVRKISGVEGIAGDIQIGVSPAGSEGDASLSAGCRKCLQQYEA